MWMGGKVGRCVSGWVRAQVGGWVGGQAGGVGLGVDVGSKHLW